MKLHVFFLSAVFLSPRSLFLFQIRDSSQTQRFREIIELFSSSVKIALWVSFSGLVWFHPRTLLSLLVDFSPEAPRSRRHLQATTPPGHVPHVYLLRGCLKWRSYLKPVFWWAEYKDVLRNIFITVLTESRGSNMKEDVEELSWYLIVRVNEATSGFLHLRGSVFLHNSPFFSRCSFLKTHVMMSLDSDLT